LAFLRFVVSTVDADSGVASGVFQVASELRKSADVGQHDRAALEDELAAECISRLYELKRILEANGHVVTVVREDRVGFVVFEDDYQVVAEPFADTDTDG
jgi:hypothetical protein